MNFSMYIPSFPNAALDSCLAEFQCSSISFSLQTILIPLPPPPAVALIITGYTIFFAVAFAWSRSLSKPGEPGTQGTPALSMVAFAEALSP